MDKTLKVIGAVVLGLLLMCLLGVVTAYPIKWAINSIFSSSFILSVFGVYKIDFWRSLLLYCLVHILRGSHESNKNSDK